MYVLLILFEATEFVKTPNGPLWNKINEPGVSYCRKHWWTNLLFLNNYLYTDEPVRLPSRIMIVFFNQILFQVHSTRMVLSNRFSTIYLRPSTAHDNLQISNDYKTSNINLHTHIIISSCNRDILLCI